MGWDIEAFEERMREEIDAYSTPAPAARAKVHRKPTPKTKTKPKPSPCRSGLKITLAVRKKMTDPDTIFTHQSGTISRLVAVQEAKKAAEKAGYPYGHIHEIENIE